MGALSPEQVSLWGLLAAGGLRIAPISFGSCTQGGEHSVLPLSCWRCRGFVESPGFVLIPVPLGQTDV